MPSTIAPKRFTPYTLDVIGPSGWVVPRLPYEADTDITVPNEQIRRIIVSLHGNGGDALAYYSNGKQIVATGEAAWPGVAAETFVIAPQFFNFGEVDGPVSDDLLYWEVGRGVGSQSGWNKSAPRQFMIRSFDVMDALLTQVSSPDLFPNLKIIVLIGHSNGGRFMAHYAAASPFEDRIARPRGVHVRYVAMNSGGFLYMDDRRFTFTDDSYKNAAHGESWRESIVELDDFGAVCTVDAEIYNHWPTGLEQLWNYPKRLGAARIREQFGRRDVIYLVGEHDDSASVPECPERVQGQDTLAKTLLYYHHLEQYYGAELKHRLRVVAGVQGWPGRRAGRFQMTPARNAYPYDLPE